MIYPQIIKSLLENDLYKFSMGQVIFHQFSDYEAEWTFKCRNTGVHFTPKMVLEIREQIEAYCSLRFAENELQYLSGITWLSRSYIDFLRIWRPNFDDFEVRYDPDNPVGLSVKTRGTWLNTSMYEVPTLAIINEVYFRMQWAACYNTLEDEAEIRLNRKFDMIQSNRWCAGTFSEFGLRRRFNSRIQEKVVEKFAGLQTTEQNEHYGSRTRFIGTSNVYLAKKFDLTPVGTMAHEFIMCVGQGNRKHNTAYSNWYAMEAWKKEYGVLNGIVLTDTITTDCFLRDFQLTFATLFSGVRHDSGYPIEWGQKILKHYRTLGIDAHQKTLLFSDSLTFMRADTIARQFQDQCKVAFGIGTYLTNDTLVDSLNIVMKVTKCNGQDVAKLSDEIGKNMCENPEYVNYLRRCIEWRLDKTQD